MSDSRMPIPQLWASRSHLQTSVSPQLRRRRRSYEEPLGSQASPFAPPEAAGPVASRGEPAPPKREPVVARPIPRPGAGPFVPPEGEREHPPRQTVSKRHNRKKTRRGGWHHEDDGHNDYVVEEEEVVEEHDDPHHHDDHEYKAPLLNPAHDVNVFFFLLFAFHLLNDRFTFASIYLYIYAINHLDL